MISEKEMENAIISNPEKFLGETGLKLLAQQHRITTARTMTGQKAARQVRRSPVVR